MSEGKCRPLSAKLIALLSALFLSLCAFALLSGCAQESISRSEGQFPNVPALLDRLAASPDEDFTEELNLTDGSNGFKCMSDLSGWNDLEEIDISTSSDDGKPKVEIFSDYEGRGSSGDYYLMENGIVVKNGNGRPSLGDEGEYVANFLNDPYGVEELFCEKTLASPNFDKEDSVVSDFLEACGISQDKIVKEDHQYYKASPLTVINGLLNGEANGEDMAGASYQIIGESKTPQGKPFYFEISFADRLYPMYMEGNSSIGLPSCICVPNQDEMLLQASFRLDEPYQLNESQTVGRRSLTPIDNKDVFLFMSESSDSGANQEAPTASESKVAYKAADTSDMVYVLIIDDDNNWSICLRSVVDGEAPEFFSDGRGNGQGVMEGTVDSTGVAVLDFAYGDSRLKFTYDSKGIKVACTEGATSTVAEIEGYYYYDLKSAV